MNRSQTVFAICLLAQMMLGVMSVWFFKERTIFTDIAFHLFYLIKNQDFAIQNNRFGALFTQSFPLLSIKAGLPLQQVMIHYSAGFVLYYTALFLLCWRWLKNSALAVSLVLFNVWMVTDTFYWIQSELPQGIALMLLYFALVLRHQQLEAYSAPQMGLLFTGAFFLAFIHPLLVIPFTFLNLYLYMRQPAHRRLLVSGAWVYYSVFVVKRCFFKTTYDTQASLKLGNFARFFPDYLDLPTNKVFLESLVHDFYLLALGLAAGTYWYARRKKYRMIALQWGFFLAYLLLIHVSYPENVEKFYIENLYLPLSIFVVVPLVFDVWPSLPTRPGIALLCAVLLLRLVHIGLHHQQYTARLDWERRLLDHTEHLSGAKLVIPAAQVPRDTLLMTWGTAYEFWLLSTLERGETRSVIIDENAEELLRQAQPNAKSFLTKWGVFNYEELPETYFVLRDETPYRLLKDPLPPPE